MENYDLTLQFSNLLKFRLFLKRTIPSVETFDVVILSPRKDTKALPLKVMGVYTRSFPGVSTWFLSLRLSHDSSLFREYAN